MWNGCYNIGQGRRKNFEKRSEHTGHVGNDSDSGLAPETVTTDHAGHIAASGNNPVSLAQKEVVDKDQLAEKIKEVLAALSPTELRQIISDFPNAQTIEHTASQKQLQKHVITSIKDLFQRSF